MNRRQMVLGTLTVAALAGSGGIAFPAPIATPRQSTGPFYPADWDGDVDWDLVRIRGADVRALGDVTYVSGRVTDVAGMPIGGAMVEIWQCDANGRYHHPRDSNRGNRRDDGFQGRGRVVTGADGRYRFRTIRPVPYPGRTPHIHFRVVTGDGREFITQMYVAGEPRNETDFLLNRITDPARRAALIVRLAPVDGLEAGALAGTFDIVLA